MKYNSYLKKITKACEVPYTQDNLERTIFTMLSLLEDVNNDGKLPGEHREELKDKIGFVIRTCEDELDRAKHFVSRRENILAQIHEVYTQWRKDSRYQLCFEDEYVRVLIERLRPLAASAYEDHSELKTWLKDELSKDGE